jgi:hypothetical protein
MRGRQGIDLLSGYYWLFVTGVLLLMAQRRGDEPNNNDNDTKQPLERPYTGPVVRRPHRDTLSRPVRPMNPEDVPTQRLPDRPTPPAPVVHRQPVVSRAPTKRKPIIKDGGRNDLHTIYNLTQRAFTNVSGFYEVEADISHNGEIMLYSVAVGREWRSMPFYLTHEAVRELILADADAAAYYGFPADDDDEGA